MEILIEYLLDPFPTRDFPYVLKNEGINITFSILSLGGSSKAGLKGWSYSEVTFTTDYLDSHRKTEELAG